MRIVSIFTVALFCLVGCKQEQKFYDWIPAIGDNAKVSLMSANPNIKHGVTEICLEFEGENCIEWEVYGYGYLHKIADTWEIAGICDSDLLEEQHCLLYWRLNNGDIDASFLIPEEPIESRQGKNLYRVSDAQPMFEWKGVKLILDAFFAKSLEVVGTDLPDNITCSENGCAINQFSGGLLVVDGYDGFDEIDVAELSAVKIEVYGGAGRDTIKGCKNCINYIRGGSGDDVLIGGHYTDYIWGDSGDDNIIGQSGDDILFGGEGDDEIFGGSGDDDIRDDGGNGAIILGQTGADWIKVENVLSGFVSGRDCSLAGSPLVWLCNSDPSDEYDIVNCGCISSYCGDGLGTYVNCEEEDPLKDKCPDDC